MLECICMRTTVDITDDQRAALAAIAARRGIRGFSAIVREAIDRYLRDEDGDDLDVVLSLEGSISDDEADEMRRRIADAWATWRPSS